MSRRSRGVEAFESLRVPEYRLLWWSGVFSFMGVQMQFLLRGLLAWELTHRESALGLVFVVFGVTMLLLTPFGGVAADRLSKRRLLIIGQALLVCVSFGMGVVVLTDVAEFWMLLVAGAVQASMFGLTGPARTSMANDLVGPELLGNAISLSMMSMSTTRIFAPSLAGLLAGVAFAGIGGAYVVAGVFSTWSLVLTWRLPEIEAVSRSTASPMADIIDGFSYVASRPPLRRVVVSSTIVIMFGFNYIAFMPALVEGDFGLGDGAVGLMSTASSLGAVMISIPVAARANSSRVRLYAVGLGIAFGATVMLLSVAPTYAVAFLITVFIGAGATGFQTLANSIVITSSDASHHGRVQSLMQLSFAGFGIVALPLGVTAEWIGLRPTIVIMGAVALGATVCFALLDRRGEETASATL